MSRGGMETGALGEERAFSPVGAGERVATLDVLRGVAILGILSVNLESFRTPEIWGGYERPFGAFERAYLFVADLFGAGKFITALSFLFGLGLALQLGRARARRLPGKRFLARRLAVLALFGAAHALLIWTGDILFLYALFGLPLLIFLGRRPRTLAIWAVGLAAGFVLLGLVFAGLSFSAPEPAAAGPGGAPGALVGPDLRAEALAAYTSGSYAEMVAQRAREYVLIFPQMLIGGTFVFPMMLLGASCAPLVGDEARRRRWARRVAYVGLLLGLPLNLVWALPAGFGPETRWYFYLIQTAWYAGALLLALGWMGLLTVLLPRLPEGLTGRLAAVGRMALTNYLAQSVLMTTFFYWGGLYGRASAGLAVALALLVWTLELIWSKPWLSRFRYGPAEWLWRRLSYGRKARARQG